MNDKEMIEEMAKIIGWSCDKKSMDYCDEVDDCDECRAIDLYNAGYRKIPEDSVVLTKSEADLIAGELGVISPSSGKPLSEAIKAQIRKETAREILKELYMHFSADSLCGIVNFNKHYNSAKVVSRLAKQYGVEIKE